MIGANVAVGLIIFSYTLIESVMQLYILQVVYGVATAISGTASSAFLGDITERATRGSKMGKLDAITGVVGAVATMSVGILADDFGFNIIFYLVAGFFVLSSIILLFIKEYR